MEDRLVWSNTEDSDYLLGLDDQGIKDNLMHYYALGLDDEMIDVMPSDKLRDFVENDEVFRDSAVNRFDDEIVEMISHFTPDGMVTLVNGDHEEEVTVDEILNSDLLRGCDKVALYDGPDGYYFLCGNDKIQLLTGGEHVKESVEPIEEAKSEEDLDTFRMELEDIKADYNDFGSDGFYQVPYRNFKKEFPLFSKYCVESFLKSLEILTKEELEDKDALDEYWQEGELINNEDWPCLFDGADIILRGFNPQWDKLWKKYYKAPEK